MEKDSVGILVSPDAFYPPIAGKVRPSASQLIFRLKMVVSGDPERLIKGAVHVVPDLDTPVGESEGLGR